MLLSILETARRHDAEILISARMNAVAARLDLKPPAFPELVASSTLENSDQESGLTGQGTKQE